MTLGIAIPTYSNHVKFLKRLLDVISKSSILPTQVSVSISSFDKDLNFEGYPFELIITKTIEYKNPSENRNIAANKLNTDIISFIDGDDLPHYKRNEYIINSFKQGCDSVVHDYYQDSNHNSDWCESNIESIEYRHNYIDIIGHPFAKSSQGHRSYHCAHISIKKQLFDTLKFDESPNIVFQEDSKYTNFLIENGLRISYLTNKLSQYNK